MDWLDLLELELRQLPGVIGVGFETIGSIVVTRITTLDATRTELLHDQVRLIIAGRLEHQGAVEVHVLDPSGGYLAVEGHIRSIDGVIACSIQRGTRSEVQRIMVTLRHPHVIREIRSRLEQLLGTPFPADRLIIETIPNGTRTHKDEPSGTEDTPDHSLPEEESSQAPIDGVEDTSERDSVEVIGVYSKHTRAITKVDVALARTTSVSRAWGEAPSLPGSAIRAAAGAAIEALTPLVKSPLQVLLQHVAVKSKAGEKQIEVSLMRRHGHAWTQVHGTAPIRNTTEETAAVLAVLHALNLSY